MRTELWLVVVTSVLAVGCGQKAPPEEQGGSRAGLQARIKAETITTTVTTTGTATATAMANLTGTATGTFTVTIYYISPVTYSRTVTSTTHHNGGGNVTGTASGTATATYASGGQTLTGTTTATGTIGAWVAGTGTRTLTVWANQTTASLTVLRTATATGVGSGTLNYTQTQTGTTTTTSTGTDTSVADGGAPDAGGAPDGGTTCIQDWASTLCGQFCTGQTQEDRRHCNLFLACYFANACGPATCGGQDDVCGVNHPGLNQWGVAPKTVADEVWKCMGCPGSVDCASPPKPDGTLCADGNTCTQYDTCQGGTCVGAYPVSTPACAASILVGTEEQPQLGKGPFFTYKTSLTLLGRVTVPVGLASARISVNGSNPTPLTLDGVGNFSFPLALLSNATQPSITNVVEVAAVDVFGATTALQVRRRKYIKVPNRL